MYVLTVQSNGGEDLEDLPYPYGIAYVPLSYQNDSSTAIQHLICIKIERFEFQEKKKTLQG